ncbi:MAG TPA: FISUMP domain-containing protein, partial [Fibrobacteraceae bacterium]|nr:FISUMP domain-containing protein [Fibrobacteraceae bacterium]
KTYTIGWCYGVSAGDTSDHSDSSTCDTYGRYYSWADAMGIDRQYLTSLWGETDTLVNFQGICPDGWHIPSAGEWSSLVEAVGGEDSAGAYLKSTSGWNNDKNGLDSYGFTALPASVRNVNGNWNGLGYYADFWEASEYDGAEALFWNLYSYRTNFISDYDDKAFGMSLRCLKTE